MNPLSKEEGPGDGCTDHCERKKDRVHSTETGGLIDLVVGKTQKFLSDCFCILSESPSKTIRSER